MKCNGQYVPICYSCLWKSTPSGWPIVACDVCGQTGNWTQVSLSPRFVVQWLDYLFPLKNVERTSYCHSCAHFTYVISMLQLPVVRILRTPLFSQVSWKPPLILNGEMLSYEIRMPDPRITITSNISSMQNHVVTNLIPFTNYSVTILACSGGNGFLGGCTESLPTHVTTHPTIPQGISPLSVTPISESFIAVSWQLPSRPNGPHLR